jgi:hypothetical protein
VISKTGPRYLKLPELDTLKELFTIDPSSPSGLKWKTPSKYSKMKPEDVAGKKTHEGYWRVKINYVGYTAHRIIFYMETGKDPGSKMIDHAKDRSDNFCIREATNAQNQANKKKRSNCTSKYKGVSYYKKHKKFKVGITVDGISIYLGYFVNEIEAALAYNKAALKYFGEFALLNEV